MFASLSLQLLRLCWCNICSVVICYVLEWNGSVVPNERESIVGFDFIVESERVSDKSLFRIQNESTYWKWTRVIVERLSPK